MAPGYFFFVLIITCCEVSQ